MAKAYIATSSTAATALALPICGIRFPITTDLPAVLMAV
jgi:hypothetical protein